jgi:hypothetical protein
MTENGNTPPASELVYVPGHSLAPAAFAAGLGGVLAGIIVWFPYGIAGGSVAIVALIAMLRGAAAEADRLPRRQELTTAVLPPNPPYPSRD